MSEDKNNWCCYLIASQSSNDTYIGSTNNLQKRLSAHNSTKSNTGAKRTRGQIWSIVMYISGFDSKSTCLSFEAVWKGLRKGRNNSRVPLVCYTKALVCYTKETKWNRLLDLIYFCCNIERICKKCTSIVDSGIIINCVSEYRALDFSWPDFVSVLVQ